jgi:hypothetical protein
MPLLHCVSLWLRLLVGLAVTCGACGFAEEAPSVTFVRLDEATADIFESDPPSPIVYAAFIQQLRRHEPRLLGIVPLWKWPGVDATQIRVLAKQVTDLSVAFAAMLDNDAEDLKLAEALQHFPKGLLLEGDLASVPRFKSVSSLPDAAFLSDPSVGFSHIDFGADARIGEDGIHVPLVALGPQGEALPSLALLMVVKALGIPWENVRLTLGSHLQLGEGYRPIAIDEAGQVMISFEPPVDLVRIAAEKLIPLSDHESIAAASPIKNSVVILGEDREPAQLFELPAGNRLSRAELIAWTVQVIFQEAISSPEPEPEPDSMPEIEPEVVLEPSQVTPSAGVTYQFPDLRDSNIGLCILGIAWGLIFGSMLMQKRPKPEVDSQPKPKNPEDTQPNQSDPESKQAKPKKRPHKKDP